MSRSRRFAVSALFIGFAWMPAGACSASDSPSGSSGFGGGNSGNGGNGGSAGMGGPMVVQSGSSNGGAPDNINPLCGMVGTCVPDQADACSGYMPPRRWERAARVGQTQAARPRAAGPPATAA